MFVTIVAPAAVVETLRAECSALGSECANMFTCELTGPDGNMFMSSGVVPPIMEDFLSERSGFYGLDVSSEDPLVAMERLQLSFIP
jgi:hypothetical protein